MAAEQLPGSSSSSEKARTPKPEQNSRRIGILPSLGIYLLEFLLPVILATVFLFWLSGAVPLWSLNRVLALSVFAIILIVLSLTVSVLLDPLTLPIRKKSSVKNLINPIGGRGRLVKYILAGILIPAGVFAAANLIALPQGGTTMALIIRYSQVPVKATPAAAIGETVLGSTSPATKIQGIKTLQAIHSTDSLEQLFRILTTDPAALNNAGESMALSAALASYGVTAKPGLMGLYSNSDQVKYKTTKSQSQDALPFYFSASFDELRKEISAQNSLQSDRDADLARLASAETALQQALSEINVNQPAPSETDPLMDFIMRTFIATNLHQDKEILQLAKTIAPDSKYADSVRGAALLLIADVGGKDELTGLYTYLGSNDEYIKAKALEAITSLLLNTPAADSSK
jgi:hypothetical protein